MAMSDVAHGAGINLFWDECGQAGVSNKTFACDRNDGQEILIGSFVLPEDMPDFVGIIAQIDIRTPGALPDWWSHGDRFTPGDECRDTTGLTVSPDFAGLSACDDPYRGVLTSGYVYDVGFLSPDRARLRFACGMEPQSANALAGGREYYGLKVILSHDAAVGPEECSGCGSPACIVLNEVRVSARDAVEEEVQLTYPDRQNYVEWQGEAIPRCPEATPARSTTWGRVRALYR
jgi:hypothetical protein